MYTAYDQGKADRRVLITGYPEDVEEARRAIEEKVHDAPKFPSIHYMIPQNRVGALIGRGGEMIRDLQERSGCKIQVQPDSQADPNAVGRIVVLTGDDLAIERARGLIDEVVHAVRLHPHCAHQLMSPVPCHHVDLIVCIFLDNNHVYTAHRQ